jgi:signal recognition particle subunit SRP54
MGSLAGIVKLIPGMGGKISDEQLQHGEAQLKRAEAMISSMTVEERRNPDLLAGSPSRRSRIAKGAGFNVNDVSKLVNDFQKMRSLMQQMGQGNFPGMGGMGGMGDLFGGGAPAMGGRGGQMPPPGWRGYQTAAPGKKKKKEKKKKGFGSL